MTLELVSSFEESADNAYNLIISAKLPELMTFRENILIYMIGCYFYYVLDKNMMSDKLFDDVCSYLGENLESIPNTEWFRRFLNKDALSAKTGYQIQKYPHFITIICNILHARKKVWNIL